MHELRCFNTPLWCGGNSVLHRRSYYPRRTPSFKRNTHPKLLEPLASLTSYRIALFVRDLTKLRVDFRQSFEYACTRVERIACRGASGICGTSLERLRTGYFTRSFQTSCIPERLRKLLLKGDNGASSLGVVVEDVDDDC